MNPWLFPWWGLLKGPLSGDVSQDISPVTSLLSPQFEFNFAGNRRIESEIIADVASYGRQLGILAEAVLEIADGGKGVAVENLKKLAGQIDKIKSQHEVKLEEKARADLDQLKQQNPKALERLLKEYD